eukprot:CAMPEP_0197564686 /NCGR_PEP_ID=MMETSP1320-20131121/30826_1 /TAXON_ID=91990 /ORGANISM="Bolidomonas sp., Strain RCC2347" /LENGTH=395 /DNA_ID=CAMNT_0043126613 /DNA_START=50 /DNA_END=1238 /DNA_ORIENTATION=-
MKLLSATLLVASFAPSSGFGQMGSTEPWRDYDYPDYPSQEQCDATPSPTGDKYTWIDQTAGAWICSTPAANADKDTCLSYGCYYHEDWNACMPSCQMDITDSPEADNCMACTFDSAWVGHPQTGDAPEGFAPGPCPSGCVQHPEGYCGLPCSAQSDNPLNFYACYFCIEDETCGGAEACQYTPPKDPTATGTDSMGSCRPGCGPGNCESCGWDECSCLDACTWNKRGGDGDDFTIPGSCEDSCEAGNCHLCDPDETGDMSRCESASGCIWDSNSGPWNEATMKNLASAGVSAARTSAGAAMSLFTAPKPSKCAWTTVAKSSTTKPQDSLEKVSSAGTPVLTMTPTPACPNPSAPPSAASGPPTRAAAWKSMESAPAGESAFVMIKRHDSIHGIMG